MRIAYKLIIIGFCGLSTAICSAQSSLETGISYFEKRAEKHIELKVDSSNINLAIASLKKALSSENDNEKAYEYLLECYYFKAAFVLRTKEQQKKIYLVGKKMGEQALQKYPENKIILLWYIANFTKYGEANGIVSSVKNGLADKVKTYAEKLLELDPHFADGAAHKIIGVINYKVPYIPLFITWPSKQKAEDHLKKALAVNPKSVSNIYYYAEFLSEVKRTAEAKVLLKRIIDSSPRKKYLIEDLYYINMGKKLLKKIDS